MTRKQIGGVCGAILLAVITPLLVLGLLHAVGDTAHAQPPPANFTKISVPDFGQHSQNWCWVGAAANSFWWYAYNVPGEEGLLGGGSAPFPWESTDLNSQNPADPCWYDANDLPQGYGGPLPIPGYRQVLSMIAQTTFMDANQNGIQEAGEVSYCYNQGVEKWDYLIGLRDYVNNYGSALTVHDIIDPARCGIGTGMLPIPQNPPAATFNTRDPCGPGGGGVPGVNQVVRTPTFVDYQTELSGGQDVLLWMESTSLETAHVVTGVGYNTLPAPGTITISDPWTHSTCPDHDDCWPLNPLPNGLMPDHNNAPGHAVGPYDTCTVTGDGITGPFTINCAGTNWTIVDLIFVSPATGADIKVLTFYSDPEGPFTFDVSTYNVINLIEDKHNNGPLDALVDVWWSMDPIEDRDGDGIPDINVRWEALPGDYCTYQGMPVACGEGDGVGTGGSGDGFPSLTGDNCEDDVDNDGDTTCDVNGCTAYPNSPDPDCGDVDDIHFQISLSVSVTDVVERPLKMHCKPRSDTQPYTLTLYNDEWPVEMEDPDPENNFQELAIEVTCQVADPHYKMYDIYDPAGLPVNEYVALEDQFHTQDNVLVTYPATLLPPAIKYVDGLYAGGGTAAPHLKCYNIEGMPPADATVNLTTQFGTETDIYVDMAGWLCVTALKEVTYPDPVPPPPPPVPLEPHYVCYDIWPAATPPTGLNIELETQFGLESGMTWETSGALCAPLIKYANATGGYLGGNLTAPHLRCYGMSTPDDPPHIVNLFSQFPPEYDVDVNYPFAMCVPAEKEIVGPDEADVKIISQTIYDADCSSPPPTDIDVSEDAVICVEKVLHNNGPYGPVTVDIVKTATAPPGCSIVAMGPPEQVDLDVSVTTAHQEWYTIHCAEASTHGPFTIDNTISIKDPGITDPDPLNNTASSSMDVNAWAYADVKIEGQQILAANCLDPVPTEMDVSEDVDICVLKLLHNNGPYAAGPVQVQVTKTASASPGAEITPPSHSEQVELYFSDVVPHVEYFTIHCSEPSTHTFYIDNDVTIKDEHIIDPDGASAHGQIDVDCLASSDIKITSQAFLDPPSQITAGVPEVVTLRKQLHNNGGYGPVTVDIDKTAYTNSPDATIAPPSASAQAVLPVSSTVIHDEDFTIGCSTPGTYTYTVDNDVAPKDVHISGGDFESTDLIVECVEGAQEIKWAQMPDDSPFGLDVSAYEPFVLAEDFLCNESGMITEIDFWASWYHDEPPMMDPNMVMFILSLHSDVPVGVDLPYSHPGEVLWMHAFDPFECTAQMWGIGEEGWLEPPDFYDPFADTQIWLYTCPIPEPYWFQQAEGTIYWVDVQALPLGPGMFGWKTSFEHWNDDGVWSMGSEPIDPLDWYGELLYPPGHPQFPQSIDLSFQIWGQACASGVDTDLDGFNDDIECYLPTDSRDDCTDNPGVHDAWPLDINIDRFVTVGGDVLHYRGRIGAWGGPPADPNWSQRLDLNMDNYITVGGDVLQFRGMIGGSCT
jgi:hypothetical protein